MISAAAAILITSQKLLKTAISGCKWRREKSSAFQSDIFLVVDFASLASHTKKSMPEDVAPTGDFGEFVTAMKAEFDPNDPGDHADESPGFTGPLRVLSSLIWSNLYVLAQAQVAYPEDLWAFGNVSSLESVCWPTSTSSTTGLEESGFTRAL